MNVQANIIKRWKLLILVDTQELGGVDVKHGSKQVCCEWLWMAL